MVQSLRETETKRPKKKKKSNIELTQDPTVLLLDTYITELKART